MRMVRTMTRTLAVLALLLAAALAACGHAGHPVPGPQPTVMAVQGG